MTSTAWDTAAVWTLRALLAALLMFCSEALLWSAPDARPAFEWALIAAAYLALAALLIDLAARWRLRDLFGLLALAGVYGLLNAALLNPLTAFADFPRTLFTRALGGQALMGVIALAWWLTLTRAPGGRSGVGTAVQTGIALAVGVVCGYWVHHSPPVFVERPETALITVGIVAGGLAAIAVGVLLIARTIAARAEDGSAKSIPLEALRLRRGGWLFVILALLPLGTAQVAAARVDAVALTTTAIFVLFCGAVIWFQKRERGATLLDNRALAIAPRRLIAPLIAGAIGMIAGYFLPRGGGETDPLGVIAALLTAYGLVWLPLVAFVLGTREFTRMSRSMRL